MKRNLPSATHRRLPMKRKSRGQSLAEFALVLPTLLLFIMGVVDFGRLLFTYAQASSQIRQALRMASVIGYDPAATPPYRDCDLMRDIADNVFFVNTMNVTVTYFDQVTDWNGTDFSGGTVCPNTAGADVGPNNLENGDVVRISADITVNLITPFFVPSVSFNLTGQRTVVTEIVLVSMPRCGDRVCQSGETCPADCVGSDTPPSVNILSPANGSPCTNVVVSGTTAVNVSASDAQDAAGTLTVAVSPDNTNWTPATWNGTTYVANWDTTSLANGCYNLYARAIDSGGSTVISTVHRVTVNNAGNTPPSISSIAPAGGNVFGAFNVDVNANDAQDSAGTLTVTVSIVSNNAITVNGTLSPLSGTIYRGAFNTSSFPGATSLTINVTVTDSGGLTATGSSTVAIGSCSPSCTPLVTITSPAGAATLMGSVNIDITSVDEDSPAAPTVTIVRVSNGSTVSSGVATLLSGNNYRYTWNTVGLTNGQYTITASYTDSTSLTGSQTITVTVSNSVSVHVNGISWTHTAVSGSTFNATFTITIVDNNGAPISGVTVSGYYGSGSSQPFPVSCIATTNASGQCTLSITNWNKDTTLGFRVNTVTHGTLTYDSSLNLPALPTLCVIPAPGNGGPAASGSCP